MFYFSYNDFMDCAEQRKIEGLKRVEETSTKYEYKKGMIKRTNIVNILNEKSELKIFLERFLRPRGIKKIKNIAYIKNLKKINENEIVCKIDDKEIYIYIKVIEKIDNNISFKIFDKSIYIIKRWREDNINNNKRYPIVIPIVIYTGNEIWKNKNTDNNLKYIMYEKNKINFSYNFIDINKFGIKKLSNSNSRIMKEFFNITNNN